MVHFKCYPTSIDTAYYRLLLRGKHSRNYEHTSVLLALTMKKRNLVFIYLSVQTSKTMPARGSDGRAKTLFTALTGCRKVCMKESREVSLMSDGLPNLASMNLAATPVPILAA